MPFLLLFSRYEVLVVVKLKYTQFIWLIHTTYLLSKPRMDTTDTWLWSIKSFQSYVLREWCRRDNGVWAVSCSKRGSRDGNLFNLFINHSQFPELSPCLLLVRGLRALVGVYFQLLKTRVLQFNFDIGVHWNSHCLRNKPPDNAFFFLKSAC